MLNIQIIITCNNYIIFCSIIRQILWVIIHRENVFGLIIIQYIKICRHLSKFWTSKTLLELKISLNCLDMFRNATLAQLWSHGFRRLHRVHRLSSLHYSTFRFLRIILWRQVESIHRFCGQVQLRFSLSILLHFFLVFCILMLVDSEVTRNINDQFQYLLFSLCLQVWTNFLQFIVLILLELTWQLCYLLKQLLKHHIWKQFNVPVIL